MHKVSSLITGAVILLLVGMLAWNAEATSLTAVVGVEPGNPLIEKVACNAADDLCDIGKQMTCTPGGPDPQCACIECEPKFDAALCPKFTRCNCKPGRLVNSLMVVFATAPNSGGHA